MLLAANSGWTPPDPRAADNARREDAMKGLQSGTSSVIELHGPTHPQTRAGRGCAARRRAIRARRQQTTGALLDRTVGLSLEAKELP